MVWLKDMVRNGILTLPEKNNAYWENMARRMVDAQAPGLAAMVRGLGAASFWNDSWQSGFMDDLLCLYLVAESYLHIEAINPQLQQDIRAAIGFTINQDELRQQSGTEDIWLVIGKSIREEQQITVEQNWLYGLRSNQYASLLQFSARGQVNQLSLTPGIYIDAELVFFPSVTPHRAIIKNHRIVSSGQVVSYSAYTGWQQVAAQETQLNSLLPFRSKMPFVVSSLKPVQFQTQWWLQDVDGYLCKIPNSFESIWPLLAMSGGEALTMSVIGQGNVYRPLGVWYQNAYKSFAS